MTSQTRTTAEDPAKALQAAIDRLHEAGVSPVSRVGTEWVERMSDMGAEVLQFLAERVKTDVDFQHRLFHCKTMQEVHDLQMDFIQTAIDRYSEETGKLMEMSAKVWTPQSV